MKVKTSCVDVNSKRTRDMKTHLETPYILKIT